MARRLAAIMFIDLAGFTALGQKNEALALSLLDDLRSILRRTFERHRGREVKTMGDGFLVELPSALDALRCAYDAQRALREFNLGQSEEHRLLARIGIHLGDVVESDGDISGDAVNVASRIEPLASPGGICVTQQVYDHVQNKADFELRPLGPQKLKNVDRPVDVYRVVLPWDVTPVTTVLDPHRLAILPFKNMSPDPNDEYFSEGMTEELITALSKLPGLTVLARTSVMQYKAATKRISDIARELRAGKLVEGSVRKAGSRVRITVQLLDGESEGHLWAENYDRDLRDIFEIQSDVAARVAAALQVRVRPSEDATARKPPTGSQEAYLLYLKGRFHWNRRTGTSVNTAKEYFEKALDLDPSFALAMVGLADCYEILSDQGAVRTVDTLPRTLQLAERALALDPGLSEAHATIASALTFGLTDWARAEREFQVALDLNPKYPTAHQWYSLLLSFGGRTAEALDQTRAARELDPLSPIINVNYWRALADSGNLDGAIRGLDTFLAEDPNFPVGHFEQAHLAFRAADYRTAQRHLEACLTLVPGGAAFLSNLAWTHAKLGRRDEALTILHDLQARSREAYVPPVQLAIPQFALGELEDAFKNLESAFSVRDAGLLYLASREEWREINGNPRFERLRSMMSESAGRRVGLPPK